jgi:iron complex outermembrane receptor protein
VDREDYSGGFVTAWWTRKMESAGELRVQGSYEYSDRRRETSEQVLHLIELDLTHSFELFEMNQVTWGLGYRGYWDDIHETFQLSYDPDEEHGDVASLFVQDEAELVKGILTFTVGSKFEYNDATGFEPQPTARLGLRPAAGHFLWAAVSRSVRTPSRADEDHQVNVAAFGPVVVSVTGSHRVKEEEVWSYEAGYRVQPWASLSADAAYFYNRYEDLITNVASGTFSTTTSNEIEGVSRGFEVELGVEPMKGWRLRANYTYLMAHYEEQGDAPASVRDDAELMEGEPRHRASIWSFLNLPGDLELDLGYRFVDKTRVPELSSWCELDAHIGWRGIPGVEVGVIGRNLLHDHHRESAATTSGGISVEELDRSVFGYLAWRF